MNSSERPLAPFLSFEIGLRLCIGMRLAQLVENLVLAHLLRRFDIVAAHGSEETSKLQEIKNNFIGESCSTTEAKKHHVMIGNCGRKFVIIFTERRVIDLHPTTFLSNYEPTVEAHSQPILVVAKRDA
ncbi:hypothetical protein KIN20_008232 [Parelaphostrongylus tenuis]|uniref:Cytochrome P450 n=1 Tax=Parelaphostrongylus tenuis TaxID=148309 RepID=A0AAD5QKI6_PARTN|nr:hypothetical protein KIN20_008232 [Parelaphostrongylus tenuis]